MKKPIAALAVTAVVSAGLAGPVFAGGPVATAVEAPVMAEPVTYAAPSADWTGAYGGVQLGYGKATGSTQFDGNGMVGGLHAGYRYDMGQFVTGIELSHDFTKLDIDSGAGKVKGITDLKLLAGADMGKVLVYGTVGASHARASFGGATASDNGYVYGIGAAYALSDQWDLGAELLGHHYKDFGATTDNLNMTTVSAKISYKF